MSIEELQKTLMSHGSQDPDIQKAAETANHYTELLKSGLINKAEYLQLINDMVHTNNINKNMDNMEITTYMHAALTGLIALASLA